MQDEDKNSMKFTKETAVMSQRLSAIEPYYVHKLSTKYPQ